MKKEEKWLFILTEATETFKVKNNIVEPSEPISEKSRKLSELVTILGGTFGGNAKYLAELVSVITGDDIFIKNFSPNIECVPFAVLVPVGVTNGHNYTLGKPLMLTYAGSSLSLYVSGALAPFGGTNTPSSYKKDYRPAKPDEIREFYYEAIKRGLI